LSFKVIDILDNLLHSEKNEIIEMSVWLISNIIFEKNDDKSKILNSKIFTTINDIITVKEKDIIIIKMIGEFYKNLLHQSNDNLFSESLVLAF
jgi:hypothetical protein